jgi:hypothetical protein
MLAMAEFRISRTRPPCHDRAVRQGRAKHDAHFLARAIANLVFSARGVQKRQTVINSEILISGNVYSPCSLNPSCCTHSPCLREVWCRPKSSCTLETGQPLIRRCLASLSKASCSALLAEPTSPQLLNRFGTRAPAPEKVLHALAAQSGEVVTPHGANAANALGLTQQVPIRGVYLTSGRTRKLKLGRSEVMVKHAPRWMLALGAGPAGAAVRALAWMGPAHVGESLADLRRTLPPAEWRTLTSARAALPSWMARAIGEEALRG